MNIRRPQTGPRPLSRRLMWWQVYHRFRKWRADRLARRIETALERIQLRTWANGLQCVFCRAVVALNANYCQECGAGLPTTEPVMPVAPNPYSLSPHAFAQIVKERPGTFSALVKYQQGHNTESQILKVVDPKIIAKLREQEGQQ